MKWPEHGGHPSKITEQLNITVDEADQLIDFSANIHPEGPPDWVKKAVADGLASVNKYPDPEYAKAGRRLARLNSVETDQVLVTNGGAEAVFLAANYFEGKRALIVQPAFSEYGRACEHYHVAVEDVFYNADDEFSLPLADIVKRLSGTDAVFLCRPNNPTGTVVPEADIRFLLDKAAASETFLVVDEAFADFMPETEGDLTGLLKEYGRLILLRSLTKMYAVPGLRAGYLLAAPDVVTQLRARQMPWSVNTMAEAFILGLPDEDGFVERSRRYFVKERTRIETRLEELGYHVLPSSANFFLLKTLKETDELFTYLMTRGIAARHTHNFKGLDGKYLRFAIKSELDNDRLLTVLSDWRRES